MHHDMNDLALSLPTPAAREAWDATQRGFLAHAAATPEALARVLAEAPDFALGHATKGLFLVLLARSELLPAAALCLRRARAGEGDARTGHYALALRAALAGRPKAAADILDEVLAVWPTDALAMKLVQALRFLTGDAAGMRRSVEAVAPQWADHPMRGYLLGCHAFALEETGEPGPAEAAGRAGLALAPDDAWGLHAVAHVFDGTGRAADGIAWLGQQEGRWAHCNNFGFHVWWHLALFHLDQGDFAAALDLYDRRVRPQPTDDFRDIANAASLLVRLEIEGVPVGTRWEELSGLAAGRVEDGALVFADLHYQLALIRGGRQAEAEALADRLARDAAPAPHGRHHAAAAGQGVAEGLIRFRDGDWAAAFAALTRALDALPAIGGSHAQRDVFWRLAIESGLRAGLFDAVEGLLARRTLARGAGDGYMQRSMDRIAAERRAASGLAAE